MSKPHVFIVDDDPEFLQMLKENLTLEEIDSTTFLDAREFVKHLQVNTPTACFIDLDIGIKDAGLAILKAVRKFKGNQIPMFIISGTTDPSKPKACMDAGADAFFKKPITVAEILSTFRKRVSDVATSASSFDPLTVKIPDGYQVNAIFSKISSELGPLVAMARMHLEDYEEFEEKIKFYSNLIVEYKDDFVKMVNSIRGKSEKIDLDPCLRHYGPGNTRNFLVAVKLGEQLVKGGLKFNKDTGAPAVPIDQIISFSKKTVDQFGEYNKNKNTWFMAGLLFDIFALKLKNGDHPQKAKIVSHIEAAFKRATETAVKAMAFAKKQKEMPLEMHLVTVPFLREIGKIAMCTYDPSYAEILFRFEKDKIADTLQLIYEEEKFKTSHVLVAAYCSLLAPDLVTAARAALFSATPEMLSDQAGFKADYLLANACFSAKS